MLLEVGFVFEFEIVLVFFVFFIIIVLVGFCWWFFLGENKIFRGERSGDRVILRLFKFFWFIVVMVFRNEFCCGDFCILWDFFEKILLLVKVGIFIIGINLVWGFWDEGCFGNWGVNIEVLLFWFIVKNWICCNGIDRGNFVIVIFFL